MNEQRAYRFILAPLSSESGGGWVAQVPELPGCIEQGETPEAALAAAKEAIADWIDYAKAEGLSVPDPLPPYGKFSGKFTIRLPRSLHGRLAGISGGVSLNQYILDRLSGANNEMVTSLGAEASLTQADTIKRTPIGRRAAGRDQVPSAGRQNPQVGFSQDKR